MTNKQTATKRTADDDRVKEAPRADANSEGESQSNYIMPSEGGSYHRTPSGSLRRTEKPTEAGTSTPDTQE